MSSLKGKTALVTGSTSGIGLGMAIALAKQGANIMVNGFGEKDEAIAKIDDIRNFLKQRTKDLTSLDQAVSSLCQITNMPAPAGLAAD